MSESVKTQSTSPSYCRSLIHVVPLAVAIQSTPSLILSQSNPSRHCYCHHPTQPPPSYCHLVSQTVIIQSISSPRLSPSISSLRLSHPIHLVPQTVTSNPSRLSDCYNLIHLVPQTVTSNPSRPSDCHIQSISSLRLSHPIHLVSQIVTI